jgi:hypothetical protein
MASACASHGSQASSDPLPAGVATTPRTPDVISHAELSDPSIGDLDALSIIKRLRPSFLATRGGAGISVNSSATGIHVIVDGGPLLPLATLTTIRANEMFEIRYLNAPAAAQAYGSAAAAAAVILIKRK